MNQKRKKYTKTSLMMEIAADIFDIMMLTKAYKKLKKKKEE